MRDWNDTCTFGCAGSIKGAHEVTAGIGGMRSGQYEFTKGLKMCIPGKEAESSKTAVRRERGRNWFHGFVVVPVRRAPFSIFPALVYPDRHNNLTRCYNV